MHAYASDDPVFVAMNRRGERETGGALGSFCVNCHAPMAVREGATTDGLNLASVPASLRGVTCYFCHAADAVAGTHNAPIHLADDLVMRGPFPDPIPNAAHRAQYSPLADRDRTDSATLCGACHDIVTGHGAAIERTFSEWQSSVFSHAPGGTTCGQCHMAQSSALQPVAEVPGAPQRRTHSHAFPGVDVALVPYPQASDQKTQIQEFLNTTLQTALCVAPSGNGASLRVILDNVAAGHNWPSGATQDRRAWVEIIAYAGSNVISQSGVASGDPIASSAADPDLWLLRDCMFDDAGKSVNMFWQAASVEGNELPAAATFVQTDPRYYQTHIVQTFPRSGAPIAALPDRVTMRVRLQAIGLSVIDDLVATGDLDAALRDQIPTYDVGPLLTWTAATATTSYLEGRTVVSCVTATNLNVQADKVPAASHTRCQP